METRAKYKTNGTSKAYSKPIHPMYLTRRESQLIQHLRQLHKEGKRQVPVLIEDDGPKVDGD